MKEYLSIGELANIFGMDVQLLRYYDACGILVPSVRNEANGRRYYHFDQVYPLATIRDSIAALYAEGARRGYGFPSMPRPGIWRQTSFPPAPPWN